MRRESQVRICERLGVKVPGPTRHLRPCPKGAKRTLRLPLTNAKTGVHRSTAIAGSCASKSLSRLLVKTGCLEMRDPTWIANTARNWKAAEKNSHAVGLNDAGYR